MDTLPPPPYSADQPKGVPELTQLPYSILFEILRYTTLLHSYREQRQAALWWMVKDVRLACRGLRDGSSLSPQPPLLPPQRLTQSRLIISPFRFSDPVVSSLDDLPLLLDQCPPAVPLVLLSSATFQPLLVVPPSSDVFLCPLGTQRALGARSVCRLPCVEPCGRSRERVDAGRRGRLEE